MTAADKPSPDDVARVFAGLVHSRTSNEKEAVSLLRSRYGARSVVDEIPRTMERFRELHAAYETATPCPAWCNRDQATHRGSPTSAGMVHWSDPAAYDGTNWRRRAFLLQPATAEAASRGLETGATYVLLTTARSPAWSIPNNAEFALFDDDDENARSIAETLRQESPLAARAE